MVSGVTAWQGRTYAMGLAEHQEDEEVVGVKHIGLKLTDRKCHIGSL